MDVFGEAIKAYYLTEDNTLEIGVASELAGDEYIPVNYLFREYNDMPVLEQSALDLAKGHVLDIGACAGAHSLVLQERGYSVTALEKSTLACDVLEDRGVINVIEQDFFDYQQDRFDTLLLLMNGIGIAGRLDKIDDFLFHCKSLLNKNGSIILESADIIYMYQDEDGGVDIDLNADFYGNMNYTISYEQAEENFDWLYVPFDLLQDACKRCGLKVRKVMDGDQLNYLAEIIQA